MSIPETSNGSSILSILNYLEEFPTEWINVIIAILVAFIGLRSYYVSRIQVRHELFERRFAIYQQFRRFLRGIHAKRIPKIDEIVGLHDTIEESRFLFTEDLVRYLEEIRQHADKIRDLKLRQEGVTDGAERERLVKAESREFHWLTEQLKALHKKFHAHMDLSVK